MCAACARARLCVCVCVCVCDEIVGYDCRDKSFLIARALFYVAVVVVVVILLLLSSLLLLLKYYYERRTFLFDFCYYYYFFSFRTRVNGYDVSRIFPNLVARPRRSEKGTADPTSIIIT